MSGVSWVSLVLMAAVHPALLQHQAAVRGRGRLLLHISLRRRQFPRECGASGRVCVTIDAVQSSHELKITEAEFHLAMMGLLSPKVAHVTSHAIDNSIAEPAAAAEPGAH